MAAKGKAKAKAIKEELKKNGPNDMDQVKKAKAKMESVLNGWMSAHRQCRKNHLKMIPRSQSFSEHR